METQGIISNFLDMVERIESAASQFYREASKLTTNRDAQLEFRKLADMELHHERRFSDLRAKYEKQIVIISEDQDQEAISRYVRAFQDSRVFDFNFILNNTFTGDENVSEVIQHAIGFEKDSIVFYAGLANLVKEGILSKLLKGIIREEFDHLSRLKNLSPPPAGTARPGMRSPATSLKIPESGI